MKLSHIILINLIIPTIFCSESSAEIYAKKFDKVAVYERGIEVLKAIADSGELDILAFRGREIALYAGTAIPGGTNDLQTFDGCYIRVITKSYRDLFPDSHGLVFVSGTVQQVIKGNMIIIMKI